LSSLSGSQTQGHLFLLPFTFMKEINEITLFSNCGNMSDPGAHLALNFVFEILTLLTISQT